MKHCAFILLFIMLCPLFAQADEVNVFYRESFEAVVTNEAPDDGALTADDEHVVVRAEGKEKAFQLNTSDGEMLFKRSFEAAGKNLILQFDLAVMSGTVDGDIQIAGNNGAYTSVLSVAGNRLYTHDGRDVGGIGRNLETIAFCYDGESGRYDVYIDNKCVLSRWYMEKKLIGFYGFRLSLNSETETEAQMQMDDIFVYEGLKPLAKSCLRNEVYNEDSVDYVPETVSDNVSKPYVNTDFSSGIGITGVSIAKKSNIIEVQKEDDGNGFLNFIKETTDDSYVDIAMTDVSKNIVLEFDIKSNALTPGGIILTKDSDNRFNYLFTVSENGVLSVGKGGNIGNVKKDAWTKVGMLLNFKKRTIDAYIDGKLTAQEAPMGSDSTDKPALFRITVTSGAGQMHIDNLKIYAGKQFKTFEPVDTSIRSKIFKDDSQSIAKLSGTIAFHTKSGGFYANGKKTLLENGAFVQDGVAFVPVRAVTEALGKTIAWDEKTQSVTIDKDIVFSVGQKVMKTGGKEIQLEAASQVRGGCVYLPLNSFAQEALGKKILWDDRGLIILSDKTVKLNKNELLDIHNYLAYDRPTAETVAELIEKNIGSAHPRIMASQADFDRVRELAQTNKTMEKWVEDLRKQVDQVLMKQAPLTYNIADGLRIVATVENPAEMLAMMYQLTGDEKYAKQLWLNIEAVCNFPDWNTHHYLDTAMMTSGVAVAYDWLYDYWSPEQKKIMEKAIREFSLNYADKTYYGQIGNWDNFAIFTNNWNGVCNGGTIVGALAIYETDPAFCSDVISNALRSVEYPLDGLYPDGAWDEGAGYWSYYMTNLLKAVKSLEIAAGTDFHITAAPGMDKTGMFPIAMEGPTGSNNFHDAGLPTHMAPSLMFYLAQEYNKPELGAAKLFSMSAYQIAVTPKDIIWYKPEFENAKNQLPFEIVYRGTEAVSMRERWDDREAAFLSYHAGKASISHSHIDCGTFVTDMLGERFAIDLGPDDYNAPGYFGSDRYKFYRIRPEGHNCVVINPDSEVGQNTSADTKVIKTVSKPRGSYSVADLTAAYNQNATKAIRGYMLCSDRRGIIIRDEIDLKKDSELYWFMHTGAEIQIIDKNTAILTQKGKKIKLSIETNAPEYELKVMNAEALPSSPKPAKQNSTAGIQKIAVYMKAQGSVQITVRMVAYDDPTADTPVYNEKIENWSIDDGEVKMLPTLNNIFINGEAMENFASDQSNYKLDILKGTPLPQITAQASDGAAVTVKPAENVMGETEITVADLDMPSYFRKYHITYNSVVTPDGMQYYAPAGVTASSTPEADNIPENVTDRDISTRWSGNGRGEWITIDLGEIKTLEVIGIGVMYGIRRKTFYEISVSADGENWSTIYKDGSTQMTDGLDYIDANGASARYVKLTGFGNSEGSNWNSITSLEAYGR